MRLTLPFPLIRASLQEARGADALVRRHQSTEPAHGRVLTAALWLGQAGRRSLSRLYEVGSRGLGAEAGQVVRKTACREPSTVAVCSGNWKPGGRASRRRHDALRVAREANLIVIAERDDRT